MVTLAYISPQVTRASRCCPVLCYGLHFELNGRHFRKWPYMSYPDCGSWGNDGLKVEMRRSFKGFTL
eukprot:360954-Amphidinium_carterae.1